ncbi:MAG TPA: recombinase family protein [Actinomycetota bacterium]|nr:recombinase family protein [Actinomycetota bacterium]
MKAVAYLRVSTREQAEEGYSIAAQLEASTRYAADNGWELVEIYSDRGESARTSDRPQFQLMLRRIAEDGSIRYLVVHKLDRLARNIRDYAEVRDLLARSGVELVSVTEGLEANASGRMVEGMLAVVAEWYSNNLSAEIRKGIAQKVREGGWPNLAPIGYCNVRLEPGPGQRRGRASIVPSDQAPLVLEAFELYAAGGLSLSILAEEMHRRGLRNRRGGRVNRSSLHEMLTNVAYIGKVPWEGATHDGAHEPIVPRDLFDEVQDLLASHGRSKERQRRHTHFLKGLLRCGTCGSRLLYNVVKGRNKRDFAYFGCASHFNARQKCGEPYVRAQDLERAIEALYREVKLPAGLQKRLESVLEDEVAAREQHRVQGTRFVARRLDRLASEKARLLDLYLSGDIDRETFRARKATAENEIQKLESRATTRTTNLHEAKQLVALALKLARNWYTSYRKASPDTKRRWNQAVFDDIVVGHRKVTETVYAEPFRTILAVREGRVSDKAVLVEMTGFEPATSCLQSPSRVRG